MTRFVSCTITAAGDITGTEGTDVICGSAATTCCWGATATIGSSGAAEASTASGGPGDDILDTVDGSGGDYAVGGEHVAGDTSVVDQGDSTALCEQNSITS